MAMHEFKLYMLFLVYLETKIKFLLINSVLRYRSSGFQSHCPRTLNMYRIYYNRRRETEKFISLLLNTIHLSALRTGDVFAWGGNSKHKVSRFLYETA